MFQVGVLSLAFLEEIWPILVYVKMSEVYNMFEIYIYMYHILYCI